MTLAPTASMIDANPEIHRVSTPQMSHGFGTPQLQGQSNPPLLENHHVLHPMLDHSPDRALPSIEVTDDSFDNAYVDFIMYCNPSIPLNVDTTELRKGFRSPPKSDGKSFSPWVLYGLISRLETKDIKTWTQLVTELGVEPPDAAKNQSTQKVQQYAVRLKVPIPSLSLSHFPFTFRPLPLILTKPDQSSLALASRFSHRCILPLLPPYAELVLPR